MARRRERRSISFPWERREGVLRLLGRRGARPLIGVLAVLGILVAVGLRGQRRSGERATRAAILVVRRAVDAYRADHDGKCPRQLDDLRAAGYVRAVPTDAWGAPLRFACPARNDALAYELSSDGPDGEPGGLDRVE